MKTILQTLFFFLLMTQVCFTQWELQMTDYLDFESVDFVNENIGWAVGNLGLISKTTNGGINWTTQISGTSNTLNSVYFIELNVGWTVGYQGIILKTTDGGTKLDNTKRWGK